MAVSQAVRVSDISVSRQQTRSSFVYPSPDQRQAYVAQIARIAVGRGSADPDATCGNRTESHDDQRDPVLPKL